uniref:Knottin scorpion toxin-like domain-containing protein n=1 Tax=Setaria viridis TaxID=4556 RepID=A0A4U6W3M7_SETVI|nr:hypothetical protein SEVIR_2G356400v2 [Setaria viridis]
MAGTNKVLLSFCLLIMLAIMSSAQEAGGVVDGSNKKKCSRVWQGWCVKAKTCVDQCSDPKVGKGLTKGHCEFYTCVCCENDSPDEIAPSAQLPS